MRSQKINLHCSGTSRSINVFLRVLYFGFVELAEKFVAAVKDEREKLDKQKIWVTKYFNDCAFATQFCNSTFRSRVSNLKRRSTNCHDIVLYIPRMHEHLSRDGKRDKNMTRCAGDSRPSDKNSSSFFMWFRANGTTFAIRDELILRLVNINKFLHLPSAYTAVMKIRDC